MCRSLPKKAHRAVLLTGWQERWYSSNTLSNHEFNFVWNGEWTSPLFYCSFAGYGQWKVQIGDGAKARPAAVSRCRSFCTNRLLVRRRPDAGSFPLVFALLGFSSKEHKHRWTRDNIRAAPCAENRCCLLFANAGLVRYTLPKTTLAERWEKAKQKQAPRLLRGRKRFKWAKFCLNN